jgi:NDP-sugar pyrophosphorylase family protein
LLADAGIDDVLISVGYLGEMIESEAGEHHPDSMAVRIVSDGPDLLGTAGALRRALDLGLLDDKFMVVYGDSYLRIDYLAIWKHFDSDRYGALMTVLRNTESLDASNVVFRDEAISLYRKGVSDPLSLGMEYVDYGMSIFRRSAIDDLVPAGVPYDLATVFEDLSQTSLLQGYEVASRFFEIGSEHGLRDLESMLTGQTP